MHPHVRQHSLKALVHPGRIGSEIARTTVGVLAAARVARSPRPLLGMVALPLMLLAVGLTASVWPQTLGAAPVPVIGIWWCSPRRQRWTWLLGVQVGIIGAEWAFVGAQALSTWPEHRPLVGGIWLAYAAVGNG